nr:pheromone biosynthesis activating neuropeptide DH-PBAN [Cephalcia chuxiongica]
MCISMRSSCHSRINEFLRVRRVLPYSCSDVGPCVSSVLDTREPEFNGARVPEESGLCSGTSCVKRSTATGISGAMWFGPRLGRRRRSDERAETVSDETNAISDVLSGAPWALVSLPDGKRRAMKVFTPRLGRESGEEYLVYNAFNGAEGGIQDDVEQRSPPFAPRLGRHLPFLPSPRLGRELRALFQNV